MKKAVSKRIKITGTGKIRRRQVAIDHFRSKKSGEQIRHKRLNRDISKGFEKKLRSYLTTNK